MPEDEIISTEEHAADAEHDADAAEDAVEHEVSEPEHEAEAAEDEAEELAEVEEAVENAPAAAASNGEAAPAEVPVEAAAPVDETKNWYIIHTYSGFEQKVADSLRSRSQAFGFSDKIGQILIPTEEVMELRAGKKVTSKRLLYPGYVLVQMEMNDQLWHEVKNTPRVTGFVGGGNSPVPLSSDEVNSILYRQQTSAKAPRPKMNFERGEMVKIIDGPFANFSGKVDEVNLERNTLRVMVTIFGRSTPVELDFLQVSKE